MEEKKAKLREIMTETLSNKDSKRLRREKMEKVKHSLLLILLILFGAILLIEVILPKIF